MGKTISFSDRWDREEKSEEGMARPSIDVPRPRPLIATIHRNGRDVSYFISWYQVDKFLDEYGNEHARSFASGHGVDAVESLCEKYGFHTSKEFFDGLLLVRTKYTFDSQNEGYWLFHDVMDAWKILLR